MESANFRRDKFIDAGGMSTVYEGWDKQLDRRVAIKELGSQSHGDLEVRNRLLEEGRQMASVEHAYVLSIYAIEEGGEDHELPWLIMEYADGGTLADKIEKGPTPPTEVAKILGNLLEGLAAIHEKMVHRDIKPENILCSKGIYKIGDFGIAQGVSENRTAKFLSSRYAAPETVRDKVGRPADLYSLGLTMYELLLGGVEFSRKSNAFIARTIGKQDGGKFTWGDWVEWYDHPDPLPAPNALDAAIPEGLSGVIHKMVAKRPGDRYQSCAEVLEALRKAQPSGNANDGDTTEIDTSAFQEDAAAKKKKILMGAVVALWTVGLIALAIFRLGGPGPVEVAVDSEPQGAVVWDGGNELGTTPIPSIELAVGTTLTFRKPGFAEVEEDVGEDATKVMATLESLARHLEVRTVPAGAEVRLDGRKLDGRTPLELEALPGQTLVLARPGFASLEVQVESADASASEGASEPEGEDSGGEEAGGGEADGGAEVLERTLEPATAGARLAQRLLNSGLASWPTQLGVPGAPPPNDGGWVRLPLGRGLTFQVNTERRANLHLFYISSDGSIAWLYPNRNSGDISVPAHAAADYGRDLGLETQEPLGQDWAFALFSERSLNPAPIAGEIALDRGVRAFAGASAEALVDSLLAAAAGDTSLAVLEIEITP